MKIDVDLTLYDIETGLRDIMVQCEEAQTDEERRMAEAILAGYVAEEIKKVDNIRGFLRHCAMMRDAAKEEAKMQAGRSQTWENRRERLSKYVVAVLDSIGMKRIEGRTGFLSVAGNGGVTPLQIDEALVPEEYKRVTVSMPLALYRKTVEEWKNHSPSMIHILDSSVDQGLIRAKLKTLEEGETVPGVVELDRGKHLRIG